MKKIGLSLLFCLSLFGCGENKATIEATSSKDSTSSSNLPVISVVASGNMPPLDFMDERGEPIGIEIDIINAIAKNQSFAVQIHHEPFADILPSISSGKYQVALSDITVTPERAAEFDHSTPYISNPTVIAHASNISIKDLADMKALRVATLQGSFHQKIINDIAPANHGNAATSFQLVQGIAQNKYDAVLNEKYIMQYLLQKYPEIKVSTTDLPTDSDKIAMFVQKGNQELLSKLNAGIAHLQQTGELDKIIAKYIQNP